MPKTSKRENSFILSRIRSEYEAGLTLREIAKRTHIAKGMIHFYLKRMGVKLRKNEAYKIKNPQEIIDAYNSGLSMEKVGEKFNCATRTVLYHLRKAGVQSRSPSENARFSQEIRQKWVYLFQQGTTPEEIANMYSTTPVYVKHILRQMGISISRKKGPHPQARRIYEMRKNTGLTWKEIAQKVGIKNFNQCIVIAQKYADSIGEKLPNKPRRKKL